MTDMIVKLYDLPDVSEAMVALAKEDIIIRQPIAPEKDMVIDWVKAQFSQGWANEAESALIQLPVGCFVAQRKNELLGFACIDATAKNFFGPTGVLDSWRGQGIGKVLLVKSLEAMRAQGYAYAIIGGVGPVAYYQKTVGAQVIADSARGIYHHMLKRSQQ